MVSDVRWSTSATETLRDAAVIDLRDDSAVVVLDSTGAVVGADDGAATLLGVESQTLLERAPGGGLRLVGTDGHVLTGREDPVVRALESGLPVVGEVVGVEPASPTTTGRFSWVEVAAYPVRDAAGAVAGATTTLRDVSATEVGRRATASVLHALQQVSRAYAEDEARFRLLAENSADVVIQADVTGRWVWVSPSVREVLGWEPSQVLGQSFAPLLHPDDRERANDLRLAALAEDSTGVAPRLELRYATADGGWRWMSALSRPLRDPAGRTVGSLTALRDIQDEVDSREELRYLAGHDALTGLLNRDAALRALDRALRRTRESERWLGVLYVDVDHFKDVNDTYGHPAGDRLLVEVGHRLTAALRDTDVVARLGGDEFLVILTSLREPVNAEKRAHALLGAVGEDDSGGLPNTTVSIGLVTDDGTGEAGGILAAADAALYRAKQAGRNRVSQ
ncbi:MAG: diguanylate cyclase [Frankiales bacterium]|nr:diguanylate cyclase [Frankiales bacterium]